MDMGVYKGSHVFEFRSESDKPIVLYGGANGAGKTTLFESIPMCLYGQNYGEKKLSKKQYHDKIYRLFHRDKDTKTAARDASVTLEFEYCKGNRIMTYQITRSWQNNDGVIEEFLKMSKKSPVGEKFEPISIDNMQLQDVINSMVPRDISSMFFFDGEKIQNIAKTGSEHTHIKAAFDSLLGLDVPSQLYDDIGLYLLRNTDDAAGSVLTELEKKNHEKQRIEKKLESSGEKRVFLESEISNRKKKLVSQEEKFFKLGGRLAQKRQHLFKEKTKYEACIKFIKTNVAHLVERDLPLAMVTEQLKQVRDEIGLDRKKIQASFEKDTLDAAFSDFEEQFAPLLDKYDAKSRTDILHKVRQTIQMKLESLSGKKKTTFDLSISDMDILLGKISQLIDSEYSIKIYRLAHEDINKKLDAINAGLDVAPEQDESGPLYTKIKEITLEIGEMEQELVTLIRLTAQEKSLLVSINADIRKCLKTKKIHGKNSRGLALAPKIQDALEDYSQRLRLQKIALLESNILKGIQKCFHKDLIVKLSIDPETYKVTLYRNNGDELARSQLSQGELQIYAMAIVWGLAKTSGRPLPFIIDTPLARLDEQHRANLINDFYPTASHQTIIFSTNTEIVNSYFDALKPHLSQAHLIQYDKDTDGSISTDGYFGDGRIAVR